MSDEPRDKQRIAELEAEVISLRERLGEPRRDEEGPASEQPLGRAPRGKVIGVAVAVALLALAAFVAIFFALSSGFDSLAKKAAKSFVPQTPAQGTGTGTGSAPPPGPVAPGL